MLALGVARSARLSIALSLCVSCQHGGATTRRAPSGVVAPEPLPSASVSSPHVREAAASARLLFSADHDSECIARGSVVYQWGGGPPGYDPRPPISVDALVVSISCSTDHSCLVTEKGDVWCYGLNELGELGFETPAACGYQGVQPCSVLPNRVPGLPAMSVVATYQGETCGISRSGAVYCWGLSTAGWRGPDVGGTTITLVPSLHDAKRLALGRNFGCAVDSIGRVWCWGENKDGQLGRGIASSFELVPQPVVDLPAAEDVSAGDGHVCALSSGRVYCWGLNEDRQVAPDDVRCDSEYCNPRPRLVSLPSGASASSISLSYVASCALDQDGKVYCWGKGRDETIGKQHDSCRVGTCFKTPHQIHGLPRLEATTYGETHMCGLASDRTFVCWGALNDIKFTSMPSVRRKPKVPTCTDCVGPLFVVDPELLLKPSAAPPHKGTAGNDVP